MDNVKEKEEVRTREYIEKLKFKISSMRSLIKSIQERMIELEIEVKIMEDDLRKY